MSSFFGRLKGSSSNPTSPSLGSSPLKKPLHLSPSLALEQLLANAGPIKPDGSDKFFGMHNPSNTCYCNSIVQCLYFSEPFREHVISYPNNRPEEATVKIPRSPHLDANLLRDMDDPTALPTLPKLPAEAAAPVTSSSPRKFSPNPATNITSANKPDENKESFDYLKKQALANGPILTMADSRNERYGMPESLFTGLKDMFEALIAHRSRTGVVTPAKFLEILRRNFETFRTPMHQDAHEFLNLLLNEVVEQVEKFSKSTMRGGNGAAVEPTANLTPGLSSLPSASAQPNPSWVHELFEGTLTSETRCLTCETVSQRDEPFLDLSVDLEEHSSVTSCLRKFSQEEMLCERNKFHCDNCGGLQEAEKRMKIKRLPRILALHLKRFKYIEELGRLQKLFHRVVYPFHLRLMNTTDDAEDPDRLYELYAVVVHLGSTPFHGHYVSIVKTKDKGWLLFDDELVIPVDKNYVRNFFGDSKSPACAYVLFYQETTVEAVQREQEAENVVVEDIAPSHAFSAGATNGTISLDTAYTVPLRSPLSEMVDPFSDPDPIKTAQGHKLHSTNITSHPHDALTSSVSNHGQSAETWGSSAVRTDTGHSADTQSGSSTRTDIVVPKERTTTGDYAKAFGFNVKPNLSRFRPSSMSIRQRPKFLDSSSKDKSYAKDVSESAVSDDPFTGAETDKLQQETSNPLKSLKPKNTLFGMGRRKTNQA